MKEKAPIIDIRHYGGISGLTDFSLNHGFRRRIITEREPGRYARSQVAPCVPKKGLTEQNYMEVDVYVHERHRS